MANSLGGLVSSSSSGGGSGSQQGPGDITNHEVKIDGNDITNFTYQTHIFQEIFTPFWTAQILIADTQNLIMNMPIKPGSKVTIKVETDASKPCSGSKNFEFRVYKISDKQMVKQETQTYIIHCISEEFFTNQKTRIQKSFKRKKPIEIANEIITKMGGTIAENDDDPTKYDLIIPNWSPVVGLEWLCRFTKTPDKKAADFVLFQSDKGAYKFKSLEKMFKDRSGLTLKQMLPHVRTNSNEDEDAFVNIEAYEFIHQHDGAKNFQTGYYANTVITHDIINKTIIQTPFKFGDDVEEDAEKPPFDGDVFEGAEQSHQTFYPKHQGSMDGTTPEDLHEQWMGSRKTNMMKFEENRLLVTIPGAACIWEWLGKAADVELPSHQDLEEGQNLDKYFKGDYLITAIKHVIGFGRYQIVMELTKKRMEKKYE